MMRPFLLPPNKNLRQLATSHKLKSCFGLWRPLCRCLTSVNDVSKSYDSLSVEKRILERWKSEDAFKRKDEDLASVFRMILPPPNVTGKLHLGHSLTIALEDTIARWKHMTGCHIEWIPGFDHAGIATQSVVNRKRSLNEKSRNESLDEALVSFSKSSLENIKAQIKATGAMLDWDKCYYTLDEHHSSVVTEGFVHLFENGMIRRGKYIVNWSCALETSVSDVEVDQVDFKGRTTFRVPGHSKLVECGFLYIIAYSVQDSGKKILVATSRPETIFGDVALAVNPEDSRNAKFIGGTAINPLNGQLLPIIPDTRVKSDFGTGVVKITPAHDKLDFLIGTDNNLKLLDIMTTDGKLNEFCGDLKGMHRLKAREEVLKRLSDSNHLTNTIEYSGSIGVCSRTGDLIEPRVLPHWFFQTRVFTDMFIDHLNSNNIVISPKNQADVLIHQLKNVQDWCLSRQISWGHKIPMYHHKSAPEEWVAAFDMSSAIKKLEKKLNIQIADETEVTQDPDVLDTWFSSSLIPLALSDWPDINQVNKISLMETGGDILLFWVWRMIIVTMAITDEIPFNDILLHGIVTDHYGRKMSKSRGNVIDPIYVTEGISPQDMMSDAQEMLKNGELTKEEYKLRVAGFKKDYPAGFKPCGMDGLRMALLSQDVFNQDIKLDTKYLENCRHFCNKLWQAMRFTLLHREEDGIVCSTELTNPESLTLLSTADLWILSCLYEFAKNTEDNLDGAKFHLYAEGVRKFFYQQFCDVYLELIKKDLNSGQFVEHHLLVMRWAFSIGLHLSHPLIPFVTEEIWSILSENKNGMLIQQKFPNSKDLKQYYNPKLNETMSNCSKLVKDIRSVKARSHVPRKEKPIFYVELPASSIPEMVQVKDYLDFLSGSEVKFEAPPKTERRKCLTYLFDICGSATRVSTLQTDSPDAKNMEEKHILKLKEKLVKLKKQYEHPSFQMHAGVEAKEKLRRKVEMLQTELDEKASNSSRSSEDI